MIVVDDRRRLSNIVGYASPLAVPTLELTDQVSTELQNGFDCPRRHRATWIDDDRRRSTMTTIIDIHRQPSTIGED
jgi:hypothetical protein